MAWGSNPELARAVGLPDKIPISNADFFDWQSGAPSFQYLAMLKSDRVNLTEADKRAYAGYARAQRHKGFETVEVRFADQRITMPDDEDDGADHVS